MGTATITISEDIRPQVDNIIQEFGFKNKEEFFQEAVRDKVLELQKKLFFRGSDEIAEQLKKQGITEKEILADFERKKHL